MESCRQLQCKFLHRLFCQAFATPWTCKVPPDGSSLCLSAPQLQGVLPLKHWMPLWGGYVYSLKHTLHTFQMHFSCFLWQIWIQGHYNKRWGEKNDWLSYIFQCILFCHRAVLMQPANSLFAVLACPRQLYGSLWSNGQAAGGLCGSHAFISLCKCSTAASRQTSERLQPPKSIN